MCGLVGFIGGTGIRSQAALAALARRMSARLRHRGPDDEGAAVVFQEWLAGTYDSPAALTA